VELRGDATAGILGGGAAGCKAPLLQQGEGGGVAVGGASICARGGGGDGAVEPAAPPFSSRGGGGSDGGSGWDNSGASLGAWDSGSAWRGRWLQAVYERKKIGEGSGESVRWGLPITCWCGSSPGHVFNVGTGGRLVPILRMKEIIFYHIL
jgi:hypothetical protein